MSVAMVENGIYSDYRSPLATRYVSKEMRYNFSDQHKFSTWRKLWIYLAKAEMYEERGICDRAGNVKIKKAFLKSKRSLNRPKPKLMDKGSTPNNSVKSAPKIASKALDCSLNPCTLEKCQSDYRIWQNSFLMDHRNGTKQNVVQLLDENGNLGITLDQYLLYENLKKNGAQNQPIIIFPSISSFLRKRRNPTKSQKYADEASARRQIVAANPPGASFVNNYATSCQCLSHDNKLISEARNPNWNSAGNLMSKVSRVLLMPNGNQRQIMLANNVGSVANVPASHALVQSNQYSFANQVQPPVQYYQNYTVDGLDDFGPMTSDYLISEIPGQCNAYDARPAVYQQEPSRDHFSQQFANVTGSDVNWSYPYSTSDRECENRSSFPELHNGIYYQTNEPQNAREVAYCDNEIIRGPIFSSMQNFDDTYTYKAPGKSTMFGNDGILGGNGQSNGEYQVEEKCGMRPILKTSNLDVKVNY